MKSFIRKACFVLAAALCTAAFTACEDDDTAGGDLQLYYSTVVDIGPSMNYQSGAPSYYGPAPSEFAIDRVTCDDQPVEVACFSIDAANGAVSIADTGELPTGTYKLSISCRAGGGTFRFSDIFVVRMVAAAPAELELSTPMLDIPYAELATTEASVTVTPVGETVSILSYALQQEEGREYFAISNKEDKGVVTLNPDFKGEILPGTYPLPICITTRAGKYTYENVLTVRITSAPLEIEYPAASGRMEQNRPFTSQGAPTVKGSPEGLAWAIDKITPSDGVEATDKIVIDPATGVISVAADSGLPVDAVYTLDLRVSNEFGSTVFEGAYTLTVIAYIEPLDPATFGYAAKEVIEGTAFSVEPNAGIVGDELTYALGELPAELVGKIEINPASGVISSVGKLSVALGEYAIPVKVENTKSSAETTFVLKVTENPNMFHLFRYGNNLGVDWETNCDQYRFAYQTGDPSVVINLSDGHHDFGDRKPTFKFEVLHNWSLQNAGDPAKNYVDDDGNVHLQLRSNRNGQIGYVRITATLGEGDAAVSRSTIIFIIMELASPEIVYTPFVYRANPRTGGYLGATPEHSLTNLVMSCRSNLFYMDLKNTNKAIKIDDGNSTNRTDWGARVWETYFKAIGKDLNVGSRHPFSYYGDSELVSPTLSNTLGYLDPTHGFDIYISPGKWMLDGEYANGIFTFQASYATDGTVPSMHSSKKKIGLGVWFDENF